MGPWESLRPRASTSILCAARVGIAHGPIGKHPVHEHPRASCALHRQEALMAPWESAPSTSIHEQPVRRARRNRSWVHEHSRSSCALNR